MKRALVLALGVGMLACAVSLSPAATAAPGDPPADKGARMAQRAAAAGPRAWAEGGSDAAAPGEMSALRASTSVTVNDPDEKVIDEGDLLSAAGGADSTSAIFNARVKTPTNPNTHAAWAGNNETGAIWLIDTNYDNQLDYIVVYIQLNGDVVANVYNPVGQRVRRGTPSYDGVKYSARLGSSCPRLRSFRWTVEFDWDNPGDSEPNVQIDFAPQTTTAPPTPLHRTGYWMLGADGKLYNFGNAPNFSGTGSASAFVTRPSGTGVWITNRAGRVFVRGSAKYKGGSPALSFGEFVSSISVLPDGTGYWLFTNRGRVFRYGDAKFYGDMRNVQLSGPIVASVATANGKGYYMVGSDGGIFSFGNAKFRGSMGGTPLVAPVVGIAPTPDNKGYWLVASDGGVFAFRAPFRGSMGGQALFRPVNGLVAFGNGYLMVASDGGVFNFSNKPFLGSLGGQAISAPIIGITAFSV